MPFNEELDATDWNEKMEEEWQRQMREMAREMEELCDLTERSADAKIRLHEARIEAAQAGLEAAAFRGSFSKFTELLRGPARKEHLTRLRQYDAAITRLFTVGSEKREARRQVIEALIDLDTWWKEDQEREREREARWQTLEGGGEV